MLTGTFPPYYGGGAKQALSLCKKLKEKGIIPLVIARNHGMKRNNTDIVEGINVYRLSGNGSVLKRHSSLLRILQYLLSLNKAFDILHVHGVYSYSLAGLLISKLLGKKVVLKMANFGGDDPDTIKNRTFGNVQLKIFSLADKIISTSSQLTDTYKKSNLPKNKLAEIVNGVDTEKFKPISLSEKISLRKYLGLPINEIIACFTGLINERKGIDLLVEAWKNIKDTSENIKLFLIGPNKKEGGISVDDKYIEFINREIKKYKLDTYITFTGMLHNIEQYLQASDIFVFPTRGEGLPNGLLEAMASGLPCIATKIPCIKDIIKNDVDGYLFNSGNFDQLTELIIKLSQDANTRHGIGINARATIEQRFSLNTITDKYIALYHELLVN